MWLPRCVIARWAVVHVERWRIGIEIIGFDDVIFVLFTYNKTSLASRLLGFACRRRFGSASIGGGKLTQHLFILNVSSIRRP